MLTFSIQDGGGIFDYCFYFEVVFYYLYVKMSNIIARVYFQTLRISGIMII